MGSFLANDVDMRTWRITQQMMEFTHISKQRNRNAFRAITLISFKRLFLSVRTLIPHLNPVSIVDRSRNQSISCAEFNLGIHISLQDSLLVQRSYQFST